MPFTHWSDVDKILEAATSIATKSQLKLASHANINVSPLLPRIVAATILKLGLAEELDAPVARPLTDRFDSRLKILHRPADPSITPASDDEAEAWVVYLRLLRRRENLSALQIEAGDIVKTSNGETAEVSSISSVGRIFFKGGRGFAAWPDQIEVVLARKGDHSPASQNARKQAQNSASNHNSDPVWIEPRF